MKEQNGSITTDIHKVLLVSPYPFTKTGRGMDVLTELFGEEGWSVTHLTFPKVFYTVKKTVNFETPVKELTGRFTLIPYIDSLMYWLPEKLFRFYQRYAASKASFIDWNHYDYVVLESGKPLFLIDSIPETVKIIYRQSDSVRLVLGKGRWYINLEDKVCHRAERIIIVKEQYKASLPEGTQNKSLTIRNGFSIPQEITSGNPYESETKNAVYVGLTPLDPVTLDVLCRDNPDINIHIFGNCLKPWQIKRLSHYVNFHYYGFRPREIYLAYLKYAEVAIFPFKHFSGMDHVGFTSKYLNFMYFGLPIVSYLTGKREEFDGFPIDFPVDAQEFSLSVKRAVQKSGYVDYKIDYEFFSYEGRRKDYLQFIRSLY